MATSASRDWLSSPAFVRILPFAVFMVFVAASSLLPPPEAVPSDRFDSRWLYAARAIVVGALLVVLWRKFGELHAGLRMPIGDWLTAIVSGAAVFVLWVLLDHGWMVMGDPGEAGFDPRQHASEELHIPLTALRLLGLVVIVPIAEELFWRSFLLRWLQSQDFLPLSPAAVSIRSLVISSVLFALEHSQWLAGLIAGCVYGWVYMRTSRLWVPIISHALTNALLGAYILVMRDWRFW